MAIDNPSLIYEYQTTLLDKTTMFSLSRQSGDIVTAEKNALTVLRYAVEKILKWSPVEMRFKFNKKVVTKLKLQRVISCISVPPEINKTKDLFYFAHILYPNQVPVDLNALTVLTYNRVVKKETCKFPKGFFDDDLGKVRAIYCMRYFLSKNEFENSNIYACSSLDKDVNSLYERFAQPDIESVLSVNRLSLARRSHWSDALDYLHESLPDGLKDEVVYHCYKIQKVYEKEIDAFLEEQKKAENAEQTQTTAI